MDLGGMNLLHLAVRGSGHWGEQKFGFSLEAAGSGRHHGGDRR